MGQTVGDTSPSLSHSLKEILLSPYPRANISPPKVEALSALKRLQDHLQEGAGPFAKRVLLEISSPEFADAHHDEAHASSPLLREIQDASELIRAEVRYGTASDSRKTGGATRRLLYTPEE